MVKVVKRNGNVEGFDISKIRKVINWACDGFSVSSAQLENSINLAIKDGIQTRDIHQNLIDHSRGFISLEESDWRYVSGKLLMQTIWKERFLKRNNIEYGTADGYLKFLDTMILNGYYDDIYKYVNREKIQDIFNKVFFDTQRDFVYDYAGALQLQKKYLMPLELPQEMYFTIALIIGSVYEKIGLDLYKEIYEALSNLKISLATPILMNLRKPNANLSSCFTMPVDDSLESIMDNAKTAANISKNGGGIGACFSKLRARGSFIRGVYGASNGVAPMIKVYNDVINAFNQLNTRKGAITVALDIWHNDILEFLEITSEEGDQRLKSFDVFTQVIVCDPFMEALEKRGKWYTFCPHEVKETYGIDLPEIWGEEFAESYEFLITKIDNLKIVTEHNAIDLFRRIMQIQIENGLPYIYFKDTANKVNPNMHDGFIRNVNLCVTPETRILTKNGYVEIEKMQGMEVDIWNGKKWSLSKVFKTGENQKILKVKLNNGTNIECTDYHRFPVVSGRNNKFSFVHAKDLSVGDKLIKFDLPVISNQSDIELDYAYTQGFFSGDGSYGKNFHPEIDLYHEKRELVGHLDIRNKTKSNKYYSKVLDEVAIYHDNNQNRTVCKLPRDMKSKDFVPLNGYTVESRLSWLSGLFDSDGCVLTNEKNQSLQLTSINFEFLHNTHLMLQTLGVDSKIVDGYPEGYRILPDSNGNPKEYYCKKTYRLLITSNGLYQLAILGFTTNRLKWSIRKPQRDAKRFVKVVEVLDEGRISDTYCFTEPERNMGMFEGVLLGNCVESFSNTQPDELIHVCNLNAVNLSRVTNKKDLEHYTRICTFILDALIDITIVPTQMGQKHNERYRTIGVGILGLADHLAYNNMNYTTGKEYIGELMEEFAYSATKASAELCDLGFKPFEVFQKSLWAEGKLIGKDLEWFKDNSKNYERWEELSEKIKNSGIRNSQITAIMPTTSTSLLQGCTASFLPPYELFIYDENTNIAPVMPRYIAEKYNYYQTNIKFDQREMVDIVATKVQPWIDTGISFELIFDLNDTDKFNAPYFKFCIVDAWKKGVKTIYYIRTEPIDDAGCEGCAN